MRRHHGEHWVGGGAGPGHAGGCRTAAVRRHHGEGWDSILRGSLSPCFCCAPTLSRHSSRSRPPVHAPSPSCPPPPHAQVYSPMRFYGLDKPGMAIGVVGLGGLGAHAVRIAKAMGCKVRERVGNARCAGGRQDADQMARNCLCSPSSESSVPLIFYTFYFHAPHFPKCGHI